MSGDAGDQPEKRLERLLADPPAPSPRAAFDYYSLGVVFDQHADYERAGQCARLALGTVEPLFTQENTSSLRLILFRSLGLLGATLRQQGAYAQAEKPLVRAIGLAEAMPEHPELAAEAWNNLGVLCKYRRLVRPRSAAYMSAMSLAQSTPETPGKNLLLAAILHNTGGLDHARGRFESAEEPARRAWEIRREFLGEEHPATLADAVAYAGVLDGLSRYAESRPIYERALAVYERVFGPDHYETAATLHNLAFVEYAEGNRARAIQLARRAYSIKAKVCGREAPGHRSFGHEPGFAAAAGRGKPGASPAVRSARHIRSRFGADHPHTACCRRLLNGGLEKTRTSDLFRVKEAL